MEKREYNCDCGHCKKRKEEDNSLEEMNLAVLVALVPLMAMTFFSQVGIL